jgi:Flp pilus assembly protein TadD
MTSHKLRILLGSGLLAAGLVSGLAGCATAPQYTETERELSESMSKESFQPANRALRDGIETQDTLAQAAFWMREYDLNPGDLESAIKLSATIRKLGNPQRAVEITQTTRALYPRDPYLAAEYAAALIASERSVDAMEPLDQALNYAPAYGRLWSLKGAALDQQEQYELARKHYTRALDITPNDPSVMANMGLSYALSGDPVTAETWLRRAVAIPGASKSVRQNLALVLQIQGKTEEAESMARMAQSQSSSRLPNLNAQPAQTIRGSASSQDRASTSLSPQSQPQATAQYNSSGNYQGINAGGGFTSPPPKITVQNSPSVQSGASASQNKTAPYAQGSSASDAARLAAQQSGARPKTQIVSPEQQQAQEHILAKLAGNVGARPANPALRRPQTSSAPQRQNQSAQDQAAPYFPGRADPGSSGAQYQPPQAQPYPPQGNTGTPYPPQPQEPRGALRERR